MNTLVSGFLQKTNRCNEVTPTHTQCQKLITLFFGNTGTLRHVFWCGVTVFLLALMFVACVMVKEAATLRKSSVL